MIEVGNDKLMHKLVHAWSFNFKPILNLKALKKNHFLISINIKKNITILYKYKEKQRNLKILPRTKIEQNLNVFDARYRFIH